MIDNKSNTIDRGLIEGNPDDISNTIPKTSSNDNGDDIEAIFERKLDDYTNLGYFPQIYKSSLQATYYGLYILEALGKLENLNQTKIVDYILDHYSEDLHIFMDEYTHRYINMNFPQMYYPLSSMLEIHCYAVLSLDILGRLDLINIQETVNFIWSCFNPEGDENGFIGQPYNDELVSEFKVATLDNTYFALNTLNLFIDDWSGYGFYINKIVPFINSLQTINGYDWFFGSFRNDNNFLLDTLGSPLFEPNLISSYYAIKSLQILNLLDTIRTQEFHTFLDVIYDEQEFKFQMSDLADALDIVANNSITQFSSECIDESYCEGNIISGNECRSIWVDIGIWALIVFVCIIFAIFIYYAKPVAIIDRKLQQKRHRQRIYQKKQQQQIQRERKKQELRDKEFEPLLRDSKRLLDQGNKLYSKKMYEAAIEKWNKSVVKYDRASKNAPLSLEQSKFSENIKILRENICNAYIKSGETHDIAAKKAHKDEDIQKADQIWKSAINDFQRALELVKSEKLDISYSYLENKINSIKLNLTQIEIEKTCVEADRKIETAQSLQEKDLIQSTKLAQESFLQYSEAKTRVDKYPEFQKLVVIILKKLENAREFQSKLQEKMEELIGIAPVSTKISKGNVPKRKQDKIDTILKTDKIKRGLSILREYDFIGGQIRFKIAIMNKTRSPLTNFKISFDLPDALKWVIHEPNYDRKGDSILISKLGVSEKKTISLYLEPINCLTSPINATISFFDARDKPQAMPMEPKMITITCPLFFTKEKANLARVKHIQHSLNHQDRKVFPIKNLEKTDLIFNSVLSALGKYDIKLIFKEFSDKDKSGEAWFYGETKIKKNKIITHVTLNGKKRKLELEVSGDSEEQITAFLAEIGNKIRQELIKFNIISSEDEFFDMNVSVLSHACPYCGEGIKEEMVREYVNGVPIQCNYCKVELFYHQIFR